MLCRSDGKSDARRRHHGRGEQGNDDTQLEIVEGMQFDKGYISPYFVTDPERMEAVIDDPYILLYEKKISSIADLVPVMEKIARSRPPDRVHCGRRGRRSAGDPGCQQNSRQRQQRRGQGSRLRRPPQGHAGRHRDSDGRPVHHRRPGPEAGEPDAGAVGHGQARHRHQRRDHDRRRRGHTPTPFRAASTRSSARSKTPKATTTRRNCRSGWRNCPAAWPSCRSARRPKPN